MSITQNIPKLSVFKTLFQLVQPDSKNVLSSQKDQLIKIGLKIGSAVTNRMPGRQTCRFIRLLGW